MSLFIVWLTLLFILFDAAKGERRWDYEPLEFEGISSDHSKLGIDLGIKRIKRGEFAMDGVIDVKYDVDDTTMIEAIAWRSNTGDEDDYKLMPWCIEKQTFGKFIENYYESMVLKNIGHCTNFPAVDNVHPFPKNAYKLDMCEFTGEGLPEIAPEGYYKIIFSATGEVDWSFMVKTKVVPKTDLYG
ncbi:uncharacterized protein LOC108595931 [Drosophila busckii]|uniref:uncharacterized protein LOC108595931 n=1 Tax=Drosophila busckii TaxID=30019 RepID=UPI00083EB5DA|nr:uncharacterized protein LOC108595931 [Drosophila busckii]